MILLNSSTQMSRLMHTIIALPGMADVRVSKVLHQIGGHLLQARFSAHQLGQLGPLALGLLAEHHVSSSSMTSSTSLLSFINLGGD
jgi:hypothetical protein